MYVTAAVLAFLGGLASAQDFEKVQIQTVPVAPGLAMLMGQGGNIAVSTGADGPVLVDDQFAPLVPKIEAAVRALQAAGQGPAARSEAKPSEAVRFVVNTHWHGDHTGGNEPLGKAGALIVAHHNVRQRMSTKQFMAAMQREVPPSPPGALPVVTFEQGVTLHWNGEQIEVEHVAPAHTDGDSLIWFRRADAVHTGDTFVNGSYPFIDRSSGGSFDGLIAACDRVLAGSGAATKIIPGHGPLATQADLRAYREMLGKVRERVSGAIARGLGQDAFIASKPLADLDPRWGRGFMKAEVFLATVWEELSGER
jgi:glyoxylase-like metal-dependent hydrolase (beta-lactamase superfamily II)